MNDMLLMIELCFLYCYIKDRSLAELEWEYPGSLAMAFGDAETFPLPVRV